MPLVDILVPIRRKKEGCHIMLLTWIADTTPTTYSVFDIAPAAEFDVVEELGVPELTENIFDLCKMGVSGKMDGGVMDTEKWVISGISVRSPLKPILAKTNEVEEEKECCTTPTSAGSRISTKMACPPAPKKRKSSSRCHYGGVREFFVPPDLETIFIRRVQGA
ncbi:hypothetical protein BUALT_Bualt05G0162700 [Buddleja alternifolia]|uniref:Uncharacterized protein n=1 Tax=Buddleja alternifolia TaxID=168488 RepID=A0AAV6XL55_9LAMI|nr:hypothetical protein BUALT_Bualt05G0162700 [Buddleja alternifolia]